MLTSLKSLITPKVSLFLLSVCLQPVVTTWAAETVFSLPSGSEAPVQGAEVGWAVCGGLDPQSFSSINASSQSLGLQVGVLSKPDLPYRRELLLFRLSAFPAGAQKKGALKKAELRLITNNLVDPNNQIGKQALQVYHQSLKDSALNNISINARSLSAFEGKLAASRAANTLPARGQELRLDVTQVIRAQLIDGKGGVACFRLQLENDGNLDASSDAYIQFRGFQGKDVSDGPHLVITYGE